MVRVRVLVNVRVRDIVERLGFDFSVRAASRDRVKVSHVIV